LNYLELYFQGLYDMNIEVMGIPMIPDEAPPLVDDIRARLGKLQYSTKQLLKTVSYVVKRRTLKQHSRLLSPLLYTNE
jgi:hypothetical protein